MMGAGPGEDREAVSWGRQRSKREERSKVGDSKGQEHSVAMGAPPAPGRDLGLRPPSERPILFAPHGRAHGGAPLAKRFGHRSWMFGAAMGAGGASASGAVDFHAYQRASRYAGMPWVACDGALPL